MGQAPTRRDGTLDGVLRRLRRIGKRSRVEARLSGRAAWQAVVGLASGDDMMHAAAIAYYALLSLFPSLLLLMSVLGSMTADASARGLVLDLVLRYLPGQLDFMTTQLDAIRETRLRVGVVGGLTLVWASLGVFAAVTSAVNEAWGVEKNRTFLKHRLASFLMLVSAGAVTGAALLLASVIQVAQASWFGAVLAQVPWIGALQSLVVRYATTLLLIVGVALVFYFVPNAKVRFRDVWVGAVLTGLLWRIALGVFTVYVARGSGLALIHGSITTVVVFMLWIYVSSVILMYGVEFTAAYARLRRRRAPTAPAAAPLV